LGIFNQFFTYILYEHFYTRLQIFIQLSPTLTKLCHTKRDHPTNFYISLEVNRLTALITKLLKCRDLLPTINTRMQFKDSVHRS